MTMDDELKNRLIRACERIVATDAKPESVSYLWSVMMDMPVTDVSLSAVELPTLLTIGVAK